MTSLTETRHSQHGNKLSRDREEAVVRHPHYAGHLKQRIDERRQRGALSEHEQR